MVNKIVVSSLFLLFIIFVVGLEANAQMSSQAEIMGLNTKDLQIKKAKVSYKKDLDLLIFEMNTVGKAGKTVPKARGTLNGAPVLGYVFLTTLKSEDVGFSKMEGVVALAVTSHPDFDDTPIWDENNDGNYKNDGSIWHTHWVVLRSDERVEGGFSVIEFKKNDNNVVLPPTNPGMKMYMDSPGYSVVINDKNLKVLVPSQRINNKKHFNFDVVSVYMEVNTVNKKLPLLGVYKVFNILSGDLSFPFDVN